MFIYIYTHTHTHTNTHTRARTHTRTHLDAVTAMRVAVVIGSSIRSVVADAAPLRPIRCAACGVAGAAALSGPARELESGEFVTWRTGVESMPKAEARYVVDARMRRRSAQ